jgi:hypothetical protein
LGAQVVLADLFDPGVVLTIGLAKPDRTSLLLPVAMRDFAIVAGITTRAFGPPAASVLGLYGVLVLVLGAAPTRTTNTSHSP